MTKYKVSIGKIFPDIQQKMLSENKECIVGISMGNPVFWRSSLKEILKWCADHFEKTTLVVADYLYRHDALIFDGNIENSAETLALNLGDDLIKKLDFYLKDYATELFHVVRWRDLMNVKSNKDAVDRLYKYYLNHDLFHIAINEQAQEFINSLIKRKIEINVPYEEAIKLSAKYLVEELAIFEKMIMEGSKVLIYPGVTLPILIAIAEGTFADIVPDLEDGIYVQLKVVRRN